MYEQASLTRLLQLLEASEEAYTEVYKYFIDKARGYAHSRLSTQLQGRVTATSIAHAALADCMEYVKKKPDAVENRVHFMALLANQIKMQLSSAKQHAVTQMRNIEREEEMPERGLAGIESLNPESKAMADELAVQVVHNIFQEPNEIKRTICVLGILGDHTTAQIQEMIEPLYDIPGAARKNSYTKRSIELIIAKRREALEEELGGGGEDHDRSVD